MAAPEDQDARGKPSREPSLGRYWQLSAKVALEASATDPASHALHDLFAAFAVSEPSAYVYRWSTRPHRETERLQLLLDDACVGLAEPEALAPLLEGSCLGLATRHMEERLVLHAAGLEVGGVGLALVGEKGSGKSTLALQSAEVGHRFFGDELLPISIDGAQAFAFPKAVTVKAGAFSLSPAGPEHVDPLRGPVRYVLPAEHAAPGSPLPLRALVFPSFASDATPATPVKLVPEEVALSLVQQTFGGLDRVPSSVECIAALSRLPCYFLPFAEGRVAVGALESIAAELRS